MYAAHRSAGAHLCVCKSYHMHTSYISTYPLHFFYVYNQDKPLIKNNNNNQTK